MCHFSVFDPNIRVSKPNGQKSISKGLQDYNISKKIMKIIKTNPDYNFPYIYDIFTKMAYTCNMAEHGKAEDIQALIPNVRIKIKPNTCF